MFRSYPPHKDNRNQSLKDLDKEANQRFGAEANRLFGVEGRRRYAPEIANMKRDYARNEVDKIRAYSEYFAAGAGLIMAYASSGYGISVSLAAGAISALATHFALPSALNKLEDIVESQTEVKTQVVVRAIYGQQM